MTTYEGARLTPQTKLKIGAIVFSAFPEIQDAKVHLMLDMMQEDGFTEQRAIDAVKQVIREHIAWGKEPPIGSFLSFDKRVKVYTYGELSTRHDKGELVFSDYEPIDLGHDKPRFAKSDDIAKFNLKKWSTK